MYAIVLGGALAARIIFEPAFALASCNIDGASGNTSPVSVSDMAKPFHGTLCGHSVYGPNCTINVDVNGTTNTDCLTVGNGVTLQGSVGGGPATITCGDSSCGKAIDISDTHGSGNTIVESVDISGCFDTGVYGGIANAFRYKDSYVDLSGSSCMGNTGVYKVQDVDTVSVRNTAIACVFSRGGSSIRDSVLTACPIGVEMSGSSNDNGSAVQLTDVAVYDTDYSIYHDCCNGPSTANATSSSFSQASVCHSGYAGGGGSGCSAAILTFSGATSSLDYLLKP
jgi:hypothetical protein